jgi:hypothetical protein
LLYCHFHGHLIYVLVHAATIKLMLSQGKANNVPARPPLPLIFLITFTSRTRTHESH